MLSRRNFFAASLAASFSAAAPAQTKRPNILFIYVDDLGFGDWGFTGNRDVPTPNVDKLATQGTFFSQFYVAAPVCSPSRVGATTGQYPARHLINTFLAARQSNREQNMRDWLDPKAPCVARTFQSAGYATGHFGKWHMGGGRDVGDAPLPQAYGFDESYTSFEGLGDRPLIEGDNLSEQSAKLGRGHIDWMPKHKLTEVYVDKTIDFMRLNREKPFYIHLWPCDVHDAHQPRPDLLGKYDKFAANPYVQKFYAVLDEFDRQLGRLFVELDKLGLADNTVVVLTGDNGPTAWPRYYKEGFEPPGSQSNFRGRKWSLYEGGIRLPLVVRWPGKVPAGGRDASTILSGIDFHPTFAALAGVPTTGLTFDGEDMSAAIKGKPAKRKRPLFFEYGRTPAYQRPGKEHDQSPNLAIRDGRWKFLMNDDGSRRELYDFNAAQN
ncbi:MAG: sulfatase-like hydrolase/transferase, partial [Acidobacteriota bacterium]